MSTLMSAVAQLEHRISSIESTVSESQPGQLQQTLLGISEIKQLINTMQTNINNRIDDIEFKLDMMTPVNYSNFYQWCMINNLRLSTPQMIHLAQHLLPVAGGIVEGPTRLQMRSRAEMRSWYDSVWPSIAQYLPTIGQLQQMFNPNSPVGYQIPVPSNQGVPIMMQAGAVPLVSSGNLPTLIPQQNQNQAPPSIPPINQLSQQMQTQCFTLPNSQKEEIKKEDYQNQDETEEKYEEPGEK